ncbi:NAT_SF domain containing protein [uncultured Caudovirales phage]|uniref:NAT_SF domain containing protein n=1 Tax=uncultured Caudovirales phage TaxID=2100421 RepID=A0A6J5LUL6_9CAUD|nr:NAT_SF domain containing protein [uncultured Caudovirales phage]
MRANEFTTEKVNADTVQQGFRDQQTVNNGQWLIRAEGQEQQYGSHTAHVLHVQVVTNNNRKEELAWSKFLVKQRPDDAEQYLESVYTFVDPKYRGQGLAKLMYQYANSLGNDIQPSQLQTDLGRGMWQGLDKTIKQPPKLTKSTPVQKPSLFGRFKSVFAEGTDFTNAVNGIEKLIRQHNLEFKTLEDLVRFVANRKFLQAQRNDQKFINDVARAVLHRIHQPQLNEINDDDELSVSQRIQDYFTDRGYKYLGEGRDQIAFLSPRNTVVKVVGIGEDEREDIVKTYVGFFLRNQRNPHYPRIYNAGDFAVDGETYFVYEMEYLHPVSGEDRVLEYIEDLMSALPRGEQALQAFYQNKTRPPELSEEQVDGLVFATQDLEDAIGGQAPLDLRSIENLGRRKDGQIVIIDPFSL